MAIATGPLVITPRPIAAYIASSHPRRLPGLPSVSASAKHSSASPTNIVV